MDENQQAPSALDTLIDGKPIGRCTAGEVRAWVKRLDAVAVEKFVRINHAISTAEDDANLIPLWDRDLRKKAEAKRNAFINICCELVGLSREHYDEIDADRMRAAVEAAIFATEKPE